MGSSPPRSPVAWLNGSRVNIEVACRAAKQLCSLLPCRLQTLKPPRHALGKLPYRKDCRPPHACFVIRHRPKYPIPTLNNFITLLARQQVFHFHRLIL